jgi:hypothetical protein
MANIEWFSPEGKSSKGISTSTDRAWSGEKKTFIFTGALILAGVLALGCSRNSKQTVAESNNQSQTSASVMPPAPSQAPVPLPASETPKKKAVRKRSSVVKYSDPVYGISFRYTRKYSLKTGEEAMKDWDGFGPVPTNFVQPGSVTIASVELPSSSYPGTDFTSAIFNVSVHRNLTAAECGQFALADKDDDADSAKPAKVKLNRTEYDEMEAVGLHGMKQADAKYYHVYQNDACYEFALGLGTQGEGTGTVDQVDREQVFRKLETILATVEIKPQPATQVATTNSMATAPAESKQP